MARVAITGLGCVTACGNSVAEAWPAVSEGRSGIREITGIAEPLKIKIGAQVRGFRPEDHFDPRVLPAYDPFSQYALVAAREAVADSGINPADADLDERMAVIIGTGMGGSATIDALARRIYGEGATRAHPNTVPRLMPSAASSNITMEFGIRGPAFAVTSACASSTHAVGEAYWMVRSGRATAAITGGSEAGFVYGFLPPWWALRVMDAVSCRPFSKDRQGFVLGEGAAVLVLEDLERAQARGARIYAEILGYGLSSDAQSLLEPSAEGAARAMRGAIREAGVGLEEIGYINAHGTGTQANDVNETRAIRQVFGPLADGLGVSSTKAVHGHALGGTGAIECLITAKAVAEQMMPPTANYTEPDPDCDLDYVIEGARPKSFRAAVTNSFAFGGLNAVLVLGT
ncbi:MAG: beta-ketoacyl-[acyl-carrier-protein] synthase family protein, partial [Rhodospirillaceae bacterium]|nr:beta-ketoacyl-[acyl-carrier-protein] synthase family protein [Rhodospirillaceae bacterium]